MLVHCLLARTAPVYIFHYNRWASVKQLQYFCESIDLRLIYDLARCKILSDICRKLPHMYGFFTRLELQYHTVNRLSHYFVGFMYECALCAKLTSRYTCTSSSAQQSNCVSLSVDVRRNISFDNQTFLWIVITLYKRLFCLSTSDRGVHY